MSYASTSSEAEASRSGVFKGIILGVVLVAPVAALLVLGVPIAHLTRAIGVGVGLAVVFDGLLARRTRRSGRLTWMVMGLLLAGLSWGLMPPLHGENLWDAHRRADRLAGMLEALPLGDQAGFRRSAEERARLMREYPELKFHLREVEKSWQQRSDEAAAPLRARLNATRKEVRELIKQDRYQAAAALADRFVRDNEKQAKEVGLLDEMNNFRELCGYVADLARRAGRLDGVKN
jgi:ElaB/YqjD/DUF883 family membrane-anchored ribosome-binding protein